MRENPSSKAYSKGEPIGHVFVKVAKVMGALVLLVLGYSIFHDFIWPFILMLLARSI